MFESPAIDIVTCRIPQYGLQNIDMIYYINLDHRPDRKHHLLQQLQQLGVPREKITRISATHLPMNPQVGCAISHLEALQRAYQMEYDTVLILEDDFTFDVDRTTLDSVLDLLWYRHPEWQAFQFAAVHQSSRPIANYPSSVSHRLERVEKADTTSAYCLKRDAIELLYPYFQQCVQLQNRRYPIDVLWNRLQSKIPWFISSPHLGHQAEQFPSDIDGYRTTGAGISATHF
jgi:GR25 family glycosyltransferase involved in LPS biosynthesis